MHQLERFTMTDTKFTGNLTDYYFIFSSSYFMICFKLYSYGANIKSARQGFVAWTPCFLLDRPFSAYQLPNSFPSCRGHLPANSSLYNAQTVGLWPDASLWMQCVVVDHCLTTHVRVYADKDSRVCRLPNIILFDFSFPSHLKSLSQSGLNLNTFPGTFFFIGILILSFYLGDLSSF